MAVIISGKLIGPNGDPRPGVTIMLTAVRTSSAVVQFAPSSSTTGVDGSYSLSVEVGTHNVMIEAYGRPFEKVGQITVYSDSKPGTLNDFLTSPGQEELTPAIVAIVDDMRADAATSAQQAKESAQYVQNIADANTYYVTPEDPDGMIAGLAGTPNGKSFRVGQGVGGGFKYYINNNGFALEVAELAGVDLVNTLLKIISTFTTYNYGALIQDGIGNVLFEFLLNGGMGSSAFNISKEGFSCAGYSVMTNTSGNIIVYDGIGNVLIDTSINNSKPDYSLDVLDMQNKLYAQSKKKPISSSISAAIYDYNIIVVYGQSWGSGYQSWRHLTRDPIEPGNVLMLGDSVRGNSVEGTFNPLGAATLKDAVSVTQTIPTTEQPVSQLMTDEDIDKLARGANNQGEELGVPAVNFWRALQRKYRGVFADPTRKIIVVNVSVPGRTIKQLAPGASTGHFENRLVRSLQQIKNALPAGAKAAVVGMLYSGNEYDYDRNRPNTTPDKDEFKEIGLDIFEATENAGRSVFGFGDKLAVFTEQTGEWWTFDIENKSIGQGRIQVRSATLSRLS